MFYSKLIKLRTASFAINHIKTIYPTMIHLCMKNIIYVIDDEFTPTMIALTDYRTQGSKCLK